MEGWSLVAMAGSPSSLCTSLPLRTPLAPSLSSPSTFSPLHARRPHVLGVSQESHRRRVTAQLGQTYDADFRQPPTEPKDTFFKILHDSKKEQPVMLRFIWLEKSLGLALDQVIPGHGTIPLTPYYFIPQKDAVGELERFIESQGWISRNRTSAILGQAAELISLWQQKTAR